MNNETSEEKNTNEVVSTETKAGETGGKDVSKEGGKGQEKTSKNYVVILIAVALICVGIYMYTQQSSDSTSVINDATVAESLSPDAVVAVVNGEEILQQAIDERLNEVSQTLIAQGVDMTNFDTKSQVSAQALEDTINYVLLRQAANASGLLADPLKVDKTFNTFLDQAGDIETFTTQLQQAGLTEETFRQRLIEQLTMDAYISNNIAVESIIITDDEIAIFYDNATASGADAPPLDSVKDQIVQQLTQQRQQELILAFTDALKESADIELK